MLKETLKKEYEKAVDNFSIKFVEFIEPQLISIAQSGERHAWVNINKDEKLKEKIGIIKSERFASNIKELLGVEVRIEEREFNSLIGEAMNLKGWTNTILILEF